ncbi:MAG: HEPN domain-containing protein [Endomicrobium sp.]|jgi:HEPN domain-containing protein|nr:HEPN domain-containing protein [Endomicrobium sp.]
MKNIIKEWIDFAQKDMRTNEKLLKYSDFDTEIVTFHCQQAIEKHFKAFLLENGWQLQKTHDIVTLHKEIKKIKDFGFDYGIINSIYKMYSDIRYPGYYNPPTEEQVREFYKFALEVEQKIKKELGVEGEESGF